MAGSTLLRFYSMRLVIKTISLSNVGLSGMDKGRIKLAEGLSEQNLQSLDQY